MHSHATYFIPPGRALYSSVKRVVMPMRGTRCKKAMRKSRALAKAMQPGTKPLGRGLGDAFGLHTYVVCDERGVCA